MEIAFFSPSSLMASSCLPSKPYTSLSSRSSLFIANGGSLRSSRSPRIVSARRRSSGGLGCRCLFGLGVPELVVIAGVAALVFGPKKLPEIGRGIGKTVKSFQQAAKEFETELKKDPEDPPPESSVTSEDEKKELEASASKESV